LLGWKCRSGQHERPQKTHGEKFITSAGKVARNLDI
jgi:hypothetical protein